MTPPRTAVHASAARRRPTAPPAGTRRRSGSGTRRPGPRRKKRRPARRRTGGAVLRRCWPVLLVAAAVLVGLAWDTEKKGVPGMPGHCTVAGSSVTLTTEEAGNAATIAAVARTRGLPERAVVIALATAQQESRIRNLDYGDRDSLGLFQQRPSQGWGTEAQVQDPVYAAGKFYDGLVRVPGWETGRLTDVAQAVQLSGFPEAYQQWEPLATELAAALSAPAGIDCRYEPAGAGNGAEVARVVEAELGARAAPRPGGEILVDPAAGWPGAVWAVARAARLGLVTVEHAGWRWTADGGWVEESGVGADVLLLRPAS